MSVVDATGTIYEIPLTVGATRRHVPIPALPATIYRYRGRSIDIDLIARLRVDDGVIFDTTLVALLNLPVRRTEADAVKTAAWIEPQDRYSRVANLRTLSPRNRLIVKLLLAVAGVVCFGNAVVGLHN